MGLPEAWSDRPLLPCLVLTQADAEDAKDAAEVEFVHAVSAGGSVKFLPAV